MLQDRCSSPVQYHNGTAHLHTANFTPHIKGNEGIVKFNTVLSVSVIIMITTIGILICIEKGEIQFFIDAIILSSMPRFLRPCGTPQIDIFLETVNLLKFKAIWAHLSSMAIYPTRLRLT